jgi:hypothetical protein
MKLRRSCEKTKIDRLGCHMTHIKWKWLRKMKKKKTMDCSRSSSSCCWRRREK